MNKFLDVINNPVLKTDGVTRYSGTYQSREERLSDHITEVSMMSYIIGLKLISLGETDINLGLLLEKCIVHDMDEVITGDIPRITKYSSDECLNSLKKLAEDTISEISQDTSKSDYIVNVWRECKSGKEGYILKLVDMLCVARKVVNEVELLGNNNFLKVAVEVSEYIVELISDVHNEYFMTEAGKSYVSDLLSSAYEVLTDIRTRNQSLINTYNIAPHNAVRK